MSVYLNELAVQLPDNKRELSIPFAWPFEAWKCLVPTDVSAQINILEKLILSLIDKKLVRNESELVDLLSKKIGLNQELTKNAIELCKQKGYINKQIVSTIQLNDQGKSILAAYSGNNNTNSMADSDLSTVYLFREMITGAIIPVFDVRSIPNRGGESIDNPEEYDGIIFHEENENQDDNNIYQTPKSHEMQNAIRTWRRMHSSQTNAEKTGSNLLATGSPQDLHQIAYQDSSSKDEAAFIQIVADRPEKCLFKGYFVLNRYCLTDIEVLSPFGEVNDSWFAIIVNRARKLKDDIDQEISAHVQEKVETLKHTIAFQNDPKVELFEQLPIICNDSQYFELKNRILSMNRYLNASREDQAISFHDFAGSMRGAIEFTIREAIKCTTDIEETRRNMGNIYAQTGNFREIRKYVQTASPDFRASDTILKNMLSAREYGFGSKDMLALISIHSVVGTNRDRARRFVSACHDWIRDLPGIIDDIGNASAHANATRRTMTPHEYYSFTETIVIDTFNYMILRGE